MHSACVHVHMYMHKYAQCGYTRHLRTCRYVAILANRPSGISQGAAIAFNGTQGVNMYFHQFINHSLPSPSTKSVTFTKLVTILLLNVSFVSFKGTDAVFRCKVEGFPKPSVTWTKGWKQITPGAKITTSYDDSTEESILTIKDVKPTDAGKYSCKLKNAMGEEKADVSLVVTPKPKEEAPVPEKAEVKVEKKLEEEAQPLVWKIYYLCNKR